MSDSHVCYPSPLQLSRRCALFPTYLVRRHSPGLPHTHPLTYDGANEHALASLAKFDKSNRSHDTFPRLHRLSTLPTHSPDAHISLAVQTSGHGIEETRLTELTVPCWAVHFTPHAYLRPTLASMYCTTTCSPILCLCHLVS